MRSGLVLACASVAACGRIGFDPIGPGSTQGVFAPVALPPGGTVNALARAADGTLYAVAGESQVFRAASGGAWTACGVDLHDLRAIAVDPATGDIYVAGDVMTTSDDGCATWREIDVGLPTNSVAILGSRVLTGTPDGVYAWDGASWNRFATPLDGYDVRDIAIDASGDILVASDHGIARSQDGGTTWALGNTGLDNLDVFFVAIAGTHALANTSDRLFYSTDGGTSWTSTADGTYTAVIDPGGAFVLSSSWSNGFITSSNGAQTWDNTDRRSAGMHVAAAERFVLGQGPEILVATNRGVFHAPDHNLAWTELDAGLSAWSFAALEETSTGVLLGGSYAGILRSSDGGASWTNESSTLTIDSAIRGIAEAPSGTLVISDVHSIARSDDQGFTYTEFWQAGAVDGYHLNAVRVIGGKIIAATWAGIEISDASWTTFTPHDVAGGARVIDVLALDSTGTQLLAATAVGLYYSSDAGVTFTLVGAGGLWVPALAQLADGTLLAGTSAGVLAASAPTGPWTASGLSTSYITALRATPGRVYAASDSGVYASSDGATWTPVPGLEHANTNSLVVDRSGRLLVGTYGYGMFATPAP